MVDSIIVLSKTKKEDEVGMTVLLNRDIFPRYIVLANPDLCHAASCRYLTHVGQVVQKDSKETARYKDRNDDADNTNRQSRWFGGRC